MSLTTALDLDRADALNEELAGALAIAGRSAAQSDTAADRAKADNLARLSRAVRSCVDNEDDDRDVIEDGWAALIDWRDNRVASDRG